MQSSEDMARQMLSEYLTEVGQFNLEKNLDELMSLDGGFIGRFDYFTPYLDKAAKENILISGCSVGSEHFVAKRYGFGDVVGTEVIEKYVDIARMRFGDRTDLRIELYNGLRLPFANDYFSCVYSGHVIEHTPRPSDYFREHMRVLKPGGFFFLEFPTRYHHKELHTGLPSVDYFPKIVRDFSLRVLSSRLSTLKSENKSKYRAILTDLQPMSVWQVKFFLWKLAKDGGRIIHHYAPAPGFVRLLIKKF